jgi:hypothetical protein
MKRNTSNNTLKSEFRSLFIKATNIVSKKIFVIILSLFSAGFINAQNSLSVFNMSCENEENPIGLETANPRFSWQINASQRNVSQSAWQIIVSGSEDNIKNLNGDIWDSGKRNTSTSVLIPFEGKKLETNKTYYWRVKIWDNSGNASAWSLPAGFQMGLLNEKDWNKAKWIALEEDKKDEIITTGIHEPLIKKSLGDKKIGMYKLPEFRKEFNVNKEIKNATAYISGLGHFDLFLNGKKAGNHFLDPGWTKYDKCALYVSFDITKQLRQGNNTIGVMLGNGFYNIPRERYLKMIASYGAPKMITCIIVEYADGTAQNIVSDAGWKVTESPVTYSSIYGGEDYDANKEHQGWKENGFNDSSWNKPVITDFKTTLLSDKATPVTIRDRIPVVKILRNKDRKYIYDLGQNFSGIVELKVRGKENKTVKLHPAELLNPDSTVNQSASGEPFYFSYTPKGSNIETWQPQFTYYGFRYVQIEGAVPAGSPNPDNLPEIIDITGLHTCNSAEEAGTFHCSNEMYNKIYNLIDWAMRSNMASVLTDCPHREKLGWLEEAHLMQYSLQYRYNLARLYHKKMNDMRSTQAGNGMIPAIAPELVEFEGGFKDTPEWGSTFIISPWYIYLWYGDTKLLEEYYPDMQKYLDYLTSRADNDIVAYGLGDWFDIGPNSPGGAQLTSNGVTATAIYYYNTKIMEKIACKLNKKEDAQKYNTLAQKIKKAFNDTYWNKETKKYDRDSQAANAVALYMGLTEEDNFEQTLQNLINDIRGRNNALTAGDVGYRYVLRALEQNNKSDIIFDMNCKYDVPGYGWQLANGATALTESWQAYGFISNNHFMLGHLMEWLFSGVGGLRQPENSTAFKEIVFRPEVVGDIRECNISYNSPYGIIKSDWKDDDETFTIRVEVPANSSGIIYLPVSSYSKITESGMELDKSPGILKHSNEGNYKIVNTGSGIYNFTVIK